MPVNQICPWKHVVHAFICAPFPLQGMGFSPSASPTGMETSMLAHCVWPVAEARCLRVSQMAGCPGLSYRNRVMDTGKDTFINRNAREGDSCQMEYSSTPLLIRSPLLVRGPAPVGMCRSAFCCSTGPWSTLGKVVLCCCAYSCVHIGACHEQSHPYRVGTLLLSCRRWSCPSSPARSEWQGPAPGVGLRAVRGVQGDSSPALAPLDSRFVLSTCKPPSLLGREGSNSTESAVSTLLSKGFTRTQAGAVCHRWEHGCEQETDMWLALPQTCPGHFQQQHLHLCRCHHLC